MAEHHKAIQLLAVAISAALAAGACTSTSKPKAGGSDRASTVIFDIDNGKPETITNFDPYGRNATKGLIQSVYEPLFITNIKTGKLEPWLALSITSDPTFTRWTLKLRNGIRWSDNTPFTSDDVVYTLEQLKAAKIENSLPLSGVSAKAIDSSTVEISLKKADSRLDQELFATAVGGDFFIALPKHIWEKQKDLATFNNYDAKKGWPVGTGPYKLSTVTPNTFTYTRRDDWWGVSAHFMSLPAPKRLQWTALGTESNRAAALASGSMDVGAQIATGTYLSLKRRAPFIKAWQDTPPYGASDVCGFSLDFNTQKGPPWDDPKLRWAASYSIDRQKLINVAFQGGSKANPSLFADYPVPNKAVAGLTGEAANYVREVTRVDLAKAETLFKEAGYTKGSSGTYEKDGKKLKLVVTNFDAAPKNAVTASLVEQLRQVGVDATQNKQTVPNFIQLEQSGKFDANVFFGTCGTISGVFPSMDSLNVSHLVPPGKKIPGYYSNPFRWGTENAKKYSQYVDEIAKLAPDDPKVQGLINSAMPYFYQDLPSVPLLYNYEINPVSTKYWTGWPTATNDYNWGLFVDASVHLDLQHLKPVR